MSTALIPAYCAGFSVVVLLAGFAKSYPGRDAKLPENTDNPTRTERLHDSDSRTYLGQQLKSVGGTTILVCRLVQLLVSLSLLGISASTYPWRDGIHESSEPVIQIAQIALYVCPEV